MLCLCCQSGNNRENTMSEEKPPEVGKAPRERKRPRVEYKPKMGCLAKMLITIIFLAVVLVIVMVIHYQFIVKPDNPEITLKDYLLLNWESTKKTVVKYKDKVIELKDLLAKSDKTLEWLDDMFPTGGEEAESPVAAAPAEGEQPEKTPGEKPETPAEKAPAAPEKQELHPEFRAAVEEFRAGLIHFKARENNEAFQRFRGAQDHLENYRKVNPDDPKLAEFEEELAPYLHAAMKDSKLK